MNKLDKFIIQGLRKKCIKEVDYKDLDIKITSTGRVEIIHLKDKKFLYSFKSKMEFGICNFIDNENYKKLIKEFNQTKTKEAFKKIKQTLNSRSFTIHKILTKEGERYLEKLKKHILKVKQEINELNKLTLIFYFQKGEVISSLTENRLNWVNKLIDNECNGK